MSRASLALLALLGGACAGQDPPPAGPTEAFVFVTLELRPTVQPPHALRVSFANDGTTVTRDFTLAPEQTFPVTLTVTTPGRTGQLDVDVEATAESGETLAHSHGEVALAAEGRADLALVLEPDDFVVNARRPGSQFLSASTDLAGRQAVRRSDGTIIVVWEDDCVGQASCNVYARRLDASGRPLGLGGTPPEDDLLANSLAQVARDPAVAASDVGTLITWPSSVTAGAPADVRASLLGPDGNFVVDDVAVSADPADEAQVMPFALADGSFLVVWVRGRPDGAIDLLARRVIATGAMSGIVTLVAAEPNTRARPSGAGLSNGNFVISWSHLDPATGATNVHARVFTAGGAFASPEYLLSDYDPPGVGQGARVAAHGDGGFVVAWQGFDPRNPTYADGPLLLRVFDSAGNFSPERRIADTTSPTGPQAVPALAVRPDDGSIGVTWSDRGPAGDGAGAAVRFRLLGADGTPCSGALVANTTTTGEQFEPSLVVADDAFLLAWTDGSAAAPDLERQAVRARFVYAACDDD